MLFSLAASCLARPAVSLGSGQHLRGASAFKAHPARVAAPARRPAAILAAAAPEAPSSARIVVQGRHLDLTQAIRGHVSEKVAKAIAHFEGVKEVDVKLSVLGNPRGRGTDAHHQRQQTVEVTVYTLRHGVVRVEETEDDLYAAVDLVADKLKRKLVKVKERAMQKANWPGRGGPKGGDTIAAHLDPVEVVDSLPGLGGSQAAEGGAAGVVREKALPLTSMALEEALEQIENVGHDFFIFRDAADGITKVLYRRKSHGYGMIIPQA